MTSASTTGRTCTAILLAGALVALAGCSADTEPLAVAGSAKAAKLTQCVEPTDFMRRNHMELIKHQRDETVHRGVRATEHSLAGCVDCHVQYDAQGQAVAIDASDQFCAGCHEFTGVNLDCFQCHATVPTGPQPPAIADRLGYPDALARPALAQAGQQEEAR
jgi:predicted CXXCH cytochrome family protein